MQVKLNKVLFYDSPKSSLYFTISNFPLPFVKSFCLTTPFIVLLILLVLAKADQSLLLENLSLGFPDTSFPTIDNHSSYFFFDSSSFTQSLKPEVPSSKVLTLLPISNRTTLEKSYPVSWLPSYANSYHT